MDEGQRGQRLMADNPRLKKELCELATNSRINNASNEALFKRILEEVSKEYHISTLRTDKDEGVVVPETPQISSVQRRQLEEIMALSNSDDPSITNLLKFSAESEFTPIGIRWADEIDRGRTEKRLSMRETDPDYSRWYTVSNEPMTTELIAKITKACADTEAIIGIIGGCTAILRQISMIQGRSKELEEITLVDNSIHAMANAVIHIEAHNSHPDLAVYVVRSPTNTTGVWHPNNLEKCGYYHCTTCSKPDDYPHRVAVVMKNHYLPKTEIRMVCSDILEHIRNVEYEKPKKAFIYLSNTLMIPDTELRYATKCCYLSPEESQHLLNAIAKKDTFAEGSIVLLYFSRLSPTESPILLQKREGTLIPIRLTPHTSGSKINFVKDTTSLPGLQEVANKYGGLYLLLPNY